MKVKVRMKRVLSPYFGKQQISASLNAADVTANTRQVGSSPTLKPEIEDAVKLSPYFKGANIETLNMERQQSDEKIESTTKSAKGQRRKAPIKVDYESFSCKTDNYSSGINSYSRRKSGNSSFV